MVEHDDKAKAACPCSSPAVSKVSTMAHFDFSRQITAVSRLSEDCEDLARVISIVHEKYDIRCHNLERGSVQGL